ncbi:uncharacterized protein [Salminus brasiliensis]|uniref:uncharacterized protein n=1 Tax=Salminus brasiliensis TaxID=930266 RepID=UPI003B83330E
MEFEPEDQILQTVPSISGVPQELGEVSPDSRGRCSERSPKPDRDSVSGNTVQPSPAGMNGATSPKTKTDSAPVASRLTPNGMTEDAFAETNEAVTKAIHLSTDLSPGDSPAVKVQRQSPLLIGSSTSSRGSDKGSGYVAKEEVKMQDFAHVMESADESTQGRSKTGKALENTRDCNAGGAEFGQDCYPADCKSQIPSSERQEGFDLAMREAGTHPGEVTVQDEMCEALDLSLPKKKGRDREKCKWVLDSGFEGSLLMEVDEIEDDAPLIEVEQDEEEEEDECWLSSRSDGHTSSFHVEDWDPQSPGTSFSPLDPKDTLLIDDQGIPYTLTPDGQKVPQIDPSEMPKDEQISPGFARLEDEETEADRGAGQGADPAQEMPLLNLSLGESPPGLPMETSLETLKVEKTSTSPEPTAEAKSTALPVISNLPSLPIQIVASNTGSNTPILLLPQSQIQTLSSSATGANPGVMTLSLPLALSQNTQSSSSSVFLVLSSPQVSGQLSQISATTSASGSLGLKPEPVSCTIPTDLSGQNKPCDPSPAPTSPTAPSTASKSPAKQIKTEPCSDTPTSFQEALVRLAVSAVQKAESQPKSIETLSVAATSTCNEATQTGSPSKPRAAEDLCKTEDVLSPVSETTSTPVDQTDPLQSPASGDGLPPPPPSSSTPPLRPQSPIFPTNHPKNQDPQALGPRRILYCQYCPRVFYYLSDLERHSITHSQNKPHVCQLCDKAFKRSSHLERHKHIHTGQRNFVCQLCPRRFREAAELTRHQRVHTGEKPFQCLLCHMRFAERNTLRRHTKRKHQGQQQEAMNMKAKPDADGVSVLGVQGQQEENAEWYSSTMTEMDSDNDTGGE